MERLSRPAQRGTVCCMIISVINQTDDEISDADLLAAIRAINQQIAYDFAPYWNMPATLRLEGRLSVSRVRIFPRP